MALHGTKDQAMTRLLLALWELGGNGQEIKRTDVTQRVVRKREKVGDYTELLAELEAKQIIQTRKQKQTVWTTIAPYSLQVLLITYLQDESFQFTGRQVSPKMANALLRLIRTIGQTPVHAENPTDQPRQTIDSYEAFKPVVLDVYNRLNRDFNLDNLVPIYRIRRELGDRVSRSNFDRWVMGIQAQDIWQLIGGEMPGLTPDKAEDSVKTALGGVRYYAKKL